MRAGSRPTRSSRVPLANAFGVLACCGVLTTAPVAHALELALDAKRCPDLPEQRVRELMELELTAEVGRPAGSERAAALISVSCTGDAVRIDVSDSTTSKLVSRTFTLTEREPDVRARAVALAAAELVITSWMELVLAKPPQQARPAPAWVNANRSEATSIVKERTRKGLGVDALFPFAAFGGTFHSHPGTWGGGLRLSLATGEVWLGGDTDLTVTLDDERTSLGTARTNTWSLALRPALRLEEGAWLGTLGLGVRLGLARIEGTEPAASNIRGHVVAGTWGGPVAHANLGVALSHFRVRLGIEGGYSWRTVWGTVDGEARAGVRGTFWLTTLGFGWGA